MACVNRALFCTPCYVELSIFVPIGVVGQLIDRKYFFQLLSVQELLVKQSWFSLIFSHNCLTNHSQLKGFRFSSSGWILIHWSCSSSVLPGDWDQTHFQTFRINSFCKKYCISSRKVLTSYRGRHFSRLQIPFLIKFKGINQVQEGLLLHATLACKIVNAITGIALWNFGALSVLKGKLLLSITQKIQY